VESDLLHGRWVHSHEEDSAGEMVFRRPDHPFPRSRGRTSFELNPDGSYVESSPGPVDVPEQSRGEWALDGDRLVLGGRHAWQVAQVEPDRLVVKR
jgi:hypothetical protein